MESISPHFKFDKFQSKKYETADDIKADLPAFSASTVQEITLSGNSYGQEACTFLASIFEVDTPHLTKVNFNDLFVGRKLQELPPSLEVLMRSLMKKEITYLDLSHNAFGPAGIQRFDFFLKEMKCLKTLKITNCGLGPEGGEKIASALSQNKEMKLEVFAAGRDRLENKGSAALAGVFEQMGSLQVVDIPQNGIKKDGMMQMLKAFIANAQTLREVYINDNWIKQEAVHELAHFILKSQQLTILNISDSDMGNEAVFHVLQALKASPQAKNTLREFYCNFNEVDSSVIAKECLEILLNSLPNLEKVEFKGNMFSKKLKAEYEKLFIEKNRSIAFVEEAEEGDEEDEEEEQEEGDPEADMKKVKKIEDEVLQMMGKLSL